jgi:hypothetical protein
MGGSIRGACQGRRDFTWATNIKNPGPKKLTLKVESQSERFRRITMAKKPTTDDARLILELYNLRRDPEMRKARQWWLATFWPKDADEYVKVAMSLGTEETTG